MRSEILNINFLENLPAQPGILPKRLLLAINIAGVACYLIIIFFLALNLPVPDSYAETASSARLVLRLDSARIAISPPFALARWADETKNSTEQTDSSVQSIALPEQARLPANRRADSELPDSPASPASASPWRDGPELRQDRPADRPIRIKIPKINVDAAIKYVGLTPDGAMGVPKGPADVAWFELGTRPGDNGSAVMSGHYGRWKNGQGSVFDNLNKLSPGDRLYVEDEKGTTITFIVRESRKYDPKADASDVFGLNDGKSRLNLVACDGVWDKVSKSYSERLVVFADKE